MSLLPPGPQSTLQFWLNIVDCLCDIWTPITQCCACPPVALDLVAAWTVASAFVGCASDLASLTNAMDVTALFDRMSVFITQLFAFGLGEFISDSQAGAGGAVPACLNLGGAAIRTVGSFLEGVARN